MDFSRESLFNPSPHFIQVSKRIFFPLSLTERHVPSTGDLSATSCEELDTCCVGGRKKTTFLKHCVHPHMTQSGSRVSRPAHPCWREPTARPAHWAWWPRRRRSPSPACAWWLSSSGSSQRCRSCQHKIPSHRVLHWIQWNSQKKMVCGWCLRTFFSPIAGFR